MRPLQLHWSRPKIRLALVLLAAPLALGLAIMVLADGLAGLMLGGLWCAFFLWLGAKLMAAGRETHAVVSVDARGVFDRRNMSDALSWDEIAHVEHYEIENMTWVGLELSDLRESGRKLKWFTRAIAPVHRIMHVPHISISTALLDGTSGDLVSALHYFRDQAGVREEAPSETQCLSELD